MLTREEDIDAHALYARGWTISAIARHLGRDRKTIRAYLCGDRDAGVRARTRPDGFEPFVADCAARLAEDPHLWATTLYDELCELGYDGSYPTLTRQLRVRGLRPACEPCRPAKGRAVAVIEHPPGDETQWDWVDLPDPPAHWGWDGCAHLLVGALSHSSRWRGLLCPSMDQPHLIDGLDRITCGLGGLTRAWRFDRMATVISPETQRVQASFAAVAKHYGVQVRPCPPRSPPVTRGQACLSASAVTGSVSCDVEAVAAYLGHAVPAAPSLAGVDEHPIAFGRGAVPETGMTEGMNRTEQPRAGEHGQLVSHTRTRWCDEAPLPTILAVAVQGRYGSRPCDQCRCALDELVNVRDGEEVANFLAEVPNLGEIILRRHQSLCLRVETDAVLSEEPRQVKGSD